MQNIKEIQSILPKLDFNVDIPMPDGVKVPLQSKFLSRWKFRDLVIIDGDGSLIANVTGFCFEEGRETVRLSWFTDGNAKEAWFDTWRLKEV